MTPAIVSAIQTTTTVGLWARTQRVMDVMPGDGRRQRPQRKRSQGGSSPPPSVVRRVHPESDCAHEIRRYARDEMASHAAPDSARGLSRSELRVDGALAVAVFVVSVALLVTGTDRPHHHGDADGLTLLLTALATLPLAARRPAPLPVFVVTALASSTVYAIAHPVGPPLG